MLSKEVRGELTCKECGRYKSNCECETKQARIHQRFLESTAKNPIRKWKKGDPLADYDG